jgi:hypothetical protein
MPVVSITRLRIRRWIYLPVFYARAFRSSRQAVAAEGNLAVRLLTDRHRTFWTGTIWSNEAAVKTFMHSGAHGAVMRKLLDWCDEAALVHWTQESSEFPSWEEAYRRLQKEGRTSKLHHPSAAHTAFQVPAPKIGRTSVTRMK